MIRGNFWTKTGFVTKSFEEAVLWISVLRDKGFIFAMTVRVYERGALLSLCRQRQQHHCRRARA